MTKGSQAHWHCDPRNYLLKFLQILGVTSITKTSNYKDSFWINVKNFCLTNLKILQSKKDMAPLTATTNRIKPLFVQATALPGNRTAYRNFRENVINQLKHRILTFLYRRAVALTERDGNLFELRKFYQFFDQVKTVVFHITFIHLKLLCYKYINRWLTDHNTNYPISLQNL